SDGRKAKNKHVFSSGNESKETKNNAGEGSSQQGPFDRMIRYANVKLHDIAGTKRSLLGDDPKLKQRIKTELADTVENAYGESLREEVKEHNKYLKKARDTISDVKSQIRKIGDNDEVKEKKLLKDIKPKFYQILDVNQAIQGHFQNLALISSENKI